MGWYRLSYALAAGSGAFLVACGGGAQGNQPNGSLVVDFYYATDDVQTIWTPLTGPSLVLDGAGNYSPHCSLGSGHLPRGTSLNARTCRFEGTPTEVGTFPITVSLTVSGFSNS